jgi:hypothetical protein
MDRDEQVFPQKIDSFEKRPRGKSSNIFPLGFARDVPAHAQRAMDRDSRLSSSPA